MYRESELPNGLKILTCADEHCPVVYINLVVRAGYRYENTNERGNAHFLEHMLLKGTTDYPAPEKLAGQVNKLGGYQNAFTNPEYVNYVIEVSREYLEPMLGLMRGMLFESLLEPSSVDTERGVILEEYNANRINHDQFMNRSITREFLRGHPLGNSSLDADKATMLATPEILRAYKDRWYLPERAAFIIGGGIDHDLALKLVNGMFSDWKAGATPPELNIQLVPANTSYLHLPRDIEQNKISLRYHTPGYESEKEGAALQLISSFLGYGLSSLLNQELRHKRGLVYAAMTHAKILRDIGMFDFTSFTRHSPQEVVPLSREIIENVTKYMKNTDFDWVRKQYLGVYARNLAETSNRTQDLLNMFIFRNSLYKPEDWVKTINSLTYEDVVDVASKYLRRENSMLTTMGKVDPGEL